jgi:hypothetical protein
VWPLEGGDPGGGDAFRILYRSIGLNGQPIAVSGAIFIPPGAAPQGSRNVIAWAHPTSGVVEACAPSFMPDVAGMIWGLADMLARGSWSPRTIPVSACPAKSTLISSA